MIIQKGELFVHDINIFIFTLELSTQRYIQDFLSLGADFIFKGWGRNILLWGRIANSNFLHPHHLKNSAPGVWEDYYIINKGLALSPLASHERFFIRGRNILFQISSGAYIKDGNIPLLPNGLTRLCKYTRTPAIFNTKQQQIQIILYTVMIKMTILGQGDISNVEQDKGQTVRDINRDFNRERDRKK